MRPTLHFRILSALAALSFVSGLRNVTLDDNDTSIIYSAGWNVSIGNNSLDFGGSLHFSDNSSVSASFTFQGVAVYLLAPFWSSRVGAQVAIDAQEPFSIDLEDYGVQVVPGMGRETVQSQVVWAATELPNVQHTIVISMPARMQHLVLDGLIYSVVDNAESIPTAETSTSLRFTTLTTTRLSTSSVSSSPASSSASASFVHSTTTASSPLPSSSNLSSSVPGHFTVVPINVGPASQTSAASTIVSAVPQAKVLSASSRRSIAIGITFGATMLILVIFALLACIRRRRIQQRRQQSYTWSRKFISHTSHSKPPPRPSTPQAHSSFGYENPPASATPLLPPAPPAARRIPRSPLATAAPIMPPTPSPRAEEFPIPLTVQLAHPLSPAPATPLPLTPLPPVTPGTPLSPYKSHRLSSASAYSDSASSLESGAGYGWTRPTLVGIHPFSAPPPESSASGSTTRPNDTLAAPALAPKLSEKSAAALFHRADADADNQRVSVAPAYREKDATRLFAAGRARAASQASDTAPPVYEP